MDRITDLSRHALLCCALCVISGFAPQPAVACFRPPGGPYPDLPKDGSHLPANLVQWVTAVDSEASYKVVVLEPGGKEREVSFESSAIEPVDGPRLYLSLRWYQVTEPVKVGSELHMVLVDGQDNHTVLTYKIAEEARLTSAQTLGEIEAEPQVGTLRIGGSYLGECSIDAKDASYARIQLQPAKELQPFEALLRYELRIDDGRSWTYDDGQQMEKRFWTSSLGAGADIVYVLCHGEVSNDIGSIAGAVSPEWRDRLVEQRQVLDPGEHKVRMVGRLPDGRELVSNEVVVDLTCSHVEPEPSTEDETASVEAEARIGHELPQRKAVATTQVASDAAGGCSVSRNSRGTAWTRTILLIGTLLLLRRRRRVA